MFVCEEQGVGQIGYAAQVMDIVVEAHWTRLGSAPQPSAPRPLPTPRRGRRMHKPVGRSSDGATCVMPTVGQ